MTTEAFYGARLRERVYDDVIVSPHLDDAVYSLAGRILAARAAGRKVLVVTVFGHGKAAAPHGKGRFDDYEAREREDREAMEALDADYVWLNEPELIFRSFFSAETARSILPFATFVGTKAFDSARRAITCAVERFAAPEATVHFPLAIGAHPDHRIVFEVGWQLSTLHDVRFYEDVPYALFPSFVTQRLSHLAGLRGPALVPTARDTAAFAFRGLGRLLSFLPLLLYVALVEVLFRIGRRPTDALVPLVPEELEVSPFVSRKVEAMCLYRSQTPLFFADVSRLEGDLPRSHGVPVERSWRFAA
ncbi:MAG: PIG-L family deacetylase [Polyangiales bacterium]